MRKQKNNAFNKKKKETSARSKTCLLHRNLSTIKNGLPLGTGFRSIYQAEQNKKRDEKMNKRVDKCIA